MPSNTVLNSETGLTSERFGVAAREMVANDPARYSIVDDAPEVAARNGPGVRRVSYIVNDGSQGL